MLHDEILESAFEVDFAGELTSEGVSELGGGAGDYSGSSSARRTSEAARTSRRRGGVREPCTLAQR